MFKVLTGQEMQFADKQAIEHCNIPGLILMENAGKAATDSIIEIISSKKLTSPKITIICGKGNNGGDGFVIARHLAEQNIMPNVISIAKENELKGDAYRNYKAAQNFVEIFHINNIDIKAELEEADIIVDAILGTGLKSAIKNEIVSIIDSINNTQNKIIVSIDIPSGINADEAQIMGAAIKADYTITFESPKVGNVLYPGKDFNGELIIKNINLPDEIIINNDNLKTYLVDKDFAKQHYPKRISNSNKSTYGKVLNIVGSRLLPGAGYLSSVSSLKTGAGYSILSCPERLIEAYSALTPDLIYKPYQSDWLTPESTDEIAEACQSVDAIVLGCGIGQSDETLKFIEEFLDKIKHMETPIIIDADGLNSLSKTKNITLPKHSIITPHPLELARLLDESTENIINNPIQYARAASQKFNCICVLKGAATVITNPEGETYINSSGNSALATAGTGDVLSGIIAGIVAQNKNVVDAKAILNAAIIGVYLHGLAGDIFKEEVNEYSLTAGELVDYIPKAINRILG